MGNVDNVARTKALKNITNVSLPAWGKADGATKLTSHPRLQDPAGDSNIGGGRVIVVIECQ